MVVAKTYLENVRSVLDQTLKDMSDSHKHTAPQVEINPVANQVILITPTSIMDLTKESMMNTTPHKEYCLMEKCNNSIRMSFRLKFEDADPMERIIGRKYLSHFTNHADDYCILRRRALEKYSISFLVTGKHLKVLSKEKIMLFILSFMEEADKNISEIKISMNSRARSIASDFIKSFCSVLP